MDQVRVKLEGLWKMLAKCAGLMCWNFAPLAYSSGYWLLTVRESSAPLLQDHFSNNDFLVVRVRVIGIQGFTNGEVRVLWQELGFGEMVLEKWGSTLARFSCTFVFKTHQLYAQQQWRSAKYSLYRHIDSN